MTRNRKGSVLLLTLFLVVLAAFAMSRFIERAYAEILSEAHYSERERLRMEAYSTLETTVAVLYNVSRMDGELFSPEQGWDDPLWLAEVYLPDNFDVRVEFIDEMGKIPLPAAGRERLLRLFEYLGFDALEAQELTEALLGWVSREEADASFTAHDRDYERAELPYRPPYRPLRSFYELAAVAGFRDAFFDGQGVPNERFHQLTSLVSLYHFGAINVNSASPAVIRIWSDVGEQEAENIESHRQTITGHQPYFRNLDEAAGQLGIPLGEGYGVSTQCVRVNVTVTEGSSSFVLSAVVAPSNRSGALRPPPPTNAGTEEGRRAPSRQPPGAGNNTQPAVPYPFTFLEVRENPAIL